MASVIGGVVFVAMVVIVAAMLLGAAAADAGRHQAEVRHAAWLLCKGSCPGPAGPVLTVHELHRDGTATCCTCGTSRHRPGPGEA